MILEQHNTRAASPRLPCAISHLCSGLANTNFDIFVWTRPDKLDELEAWAFPGTDGVRCRVHIMPIEPASVSLPPNVRPDNVWRGNPPWNPTMFGMEYRLMGRWRLGYSFAFARALGYDFMLQLDDDSFLNTTHAGGDLLELLRAHNASMATHSSSLQLEVPNAVIGLTQLVRFWYETRVSSALVVGVSQVNAARFRAVTGPLFQHFEPPNVEGLSTGAWDHIIVQSNFLLVNLDFWFSDDVQDL
jgi:hypothetical protein